MHRQIAKWIVTGLAALLASCGGSSDDPPAKTQLFATGGDAAVYRGVWRSECGTVPGTTMQGAKFEFDITGAVGNVASGNLITRYYFSEQSCTGGASPLSTSTAAVTLTIDSAATSVDGDYTGLADKVVVASPGTTSTTAYFGFVSAKDRFYISSSASFSVLRPAYTKSAP